MAKVSPLIDIRNLSLSHGTQILFENISLSVFPGDRMGIVGPNGAGKSSLLKLILGEESGERGTIAIRQGLRIGYAGQSPEFLPVTIEEILSPFAPSHEVKAILSKVGFTDFQQIASTLSGGWKKRLDLARALSGAPDVLFLDEPTNHLDLEGILWLEKFLQRERITYVIISHDRYFLETVSNRIFELNRCYPQGTFAIDGSFSTFLEEKERFLEGQKQRQRSLASVVRGESEWLRRSPKARTTKSRSRIQQAYVFMDELHHLNERNKERRVDLSFSASERETRKLIVAKNLSKSMGGKLLFSHLDLTLSPGSCIGLLGQNGTGKTTLMKLLAGQLEPDLGTIKRADDLKIVYFDQHREDIPPHLTLREALGDGNDTVFYQGQAIHVNGWARRFLFDANRMELPVSCLSGGEKARIHIARLMLKPADVLFLDEPTNDLDIPTLEVLEESLNEFSGAVVLISHDRCLMDRLCTAVIGLGDEKAHLFADYTQWESARKKPEIPLTEKNTAPPPKTSSPKKRSYKELKELEEIPKKIEEEDKNIAALHKQLENGNVNPDLYQQLADAEKRLEVLFTRWEELEKGP